MSLKEKRLQVKKKEAERKEAKDEFEWDGKKRG
jgi:hypothetical protein